MKVHHDKPLANFPVPNDADYGIFMYDNSMMNVRIFEDDLLFIKVGAEIKNGDVAAIELPGKGVIIRRVFVSEDGKKLTLCAAHPLYADMEFTGDFDKQVNVFAKVMYSVHEHGNDTFDL